MKLRACLLLLVVFTLVWQSDGWWRRRRRRRSSTRNCPGRPALPNNVTWSGCSAPYSHKEKCRYRCQPGYTRVSGSTTRTCSNGVWTGSSLVCMRAPRPAPTYRKCIGQTRSNVQSIPLYGPLSGQKSSGPVVNGDTSCNNHPHSSNSAGSAPFFHGTSPLSRRRRRAVSEVFQWSIVHRVLLFRGEVFEWGVGSKRESWEGRRCPSDCVVSWTKSAAGYSTCTREQAEFFAREYKSRYGSYDLFSNNCHIFVNRLMRYLDSGCNKMP
ncbi:uncharacterized protein LOC118421666 [Branchiostoma floridae]|uniref:Uncharacterized protein LOC118421666 n=1 Tax=Branchiostoma floridae TaxID=7739 RepID=A0A9J7LNG7_BRAFL|nr:uncharacterized protein LOC118421666 [Branchiostoma floridae]XP_035685005.1 uncharacterized protein LOC118421666 [Branchiostoma floridae]